MNYIKHEEEINLRNYIESSIKQIMCLYNFKEIRTPVIIDKGLYKKYAEFSQRYVRIDIEKFAINLEGANNYCLRPEGTISVLNSVFINEVVNKTQKIYYQGPMFRKNLDSDNYSSQYHQVGAEILGSDNVISDLEIILLAQSILSSMKLENILVEISSHGCQKCIQPYLDALREFLEFNYENLCEECKEKMFDYPLTIHRCINSNCKTISNMSPKYTDYLCVDCEKNFKIIKRLLSNLGINCVVTPNLLLDFDYYTRFVFRFVYLHNDKQYVLIKGGRYNNLASFITQTTMPAVGFSFSIDETIRIIKETNVKTMKKHEKSACIGAISKDMELQILQTEQELQNLGFKAIIIENLVDIRNIESIFKTYNCDIILLYEKDLIKDAKIILYSKNEQFGKTIELKDLSKLTVGN